MHIFIDINSQINSIEDEQIFTQISVEGDCKLKKSSQVPSRINFEKRINVTLVLFQPSSLSQLLLALLIHDRHEKVHERKYEDQQVKPHNQTHVDLEIVPETNRVCNLFSKILQIHSYSECFVDQMYSLYMYMIQIVKEAS